MAAVADRTRAPGLVWFRILVVVGVLLGILLLTQAIRNYNYVSERLVREQARREATQFSMELDRDTRRIRPGSQADMQQLVGELWREHTGNVAWVRVLDATEGLIAESGVTGSEPLTEEQIQAALQSPEKMEQTKSGPVLVRSMPFRQPFRPRPPGLQPDRSRSGGPPPARLEEPPPFEPGRQPEPGPPPEGRRGGGFGNGGRGGFRQRTPRLLEVAVYLGRDTAILGPLRRNLIVSSSAAVALLIAMAVLGLRFRSYVHGRQLEEQLALARRVQQDLLPEIEPLGEEMDFAAQCVPAWQVGGDFYDVFDAGDGRIALVLGDVSGKGLPAALLMGLLHGAVRTSHWTESAAEHEEATRKLNHLLCTRTSRERYASLFWGYYDTRLHLVRYINAGHLPPVIVRRESNGKLSVIRLEGGGPVVGLLQSVDFRQQQAEVRPGDVLVLCSDGIEEAMDGRDEEFGEARLIAAIKENWGKPAGEIQDAILKQVKQFLKGRAAHDDQTLVVARLWDPQAEPERKATLADEVLVG